MTSRLNAGDPTLGSGDYKKNDYALWTIKPGITVEAGVSVYHGRVRTISMSMRQAVTGAVPIATPHVTTSGDIPMVAIGLPFEPEAPKPVSPAHLLFQDVTIEDIESLPPTVKSSAPNWIAAAKRFSINAALVETFRRMNLLASSTTVAHKRLIATWKGEQTPFHIGTSNRPR